MAILESSVRFTGSLGDLSAYIRRGSDKVILRRKGGASKKRIMTAPAFENTRRINSEFSGRSMATKWLMRALQHHRPLADHSFTGKINALLKPIQELDTVSPWGKRAIILTANPSLLEGFPLNMGTTFEAIVRAPLICDISHDTHKVTAQLPQLVPGINFFPPPHHPVFSLVIGAGIMPDLHFSGNAYRPVNESIQEFPPVAIETPWHPTNESMEPLTLNLQLPDEFFQENTSIVITVGIKYGWILPDGTAQQIKHTGAATIKKISNS